MYIILPSVEHKMFKQGNIITRYKEKYDQGKENVRVKHRTTTNQNVDARIFRRTAQTTKKMNVDPKPMRGGIRL